MGEAGDANAKSQTAYLLFFRFAGPKTFRTEWAAEFEEVVRSSTRFRVADVAGKVALRQSADGLLLVFVSAPNAPLECAVEVERALRKRSEIRVRAGIHHGPVRWDGGLDDESALTRDTINVVRQLASLGDAGHILLSKRTAYELASNPRWNEHFYELEDGKSGTAVVNFYDGEVGCPELPTNIVSRRVRFARQQKFRSIRRAILTLLVIVFLAAVTATGYVLVQRVLTVPPTARTGTAENTVLVLPFLDLSPERDQGYLAEGMSEEILEQVASIKTLRVIARTSAFAFKNRNTEPGEIARVLNAQTIVQGNVRREGSWIRIAAEVRNTRESSQRWAKTFEANVRDVPAIEKEISEAVAHALGAAPPMLLRTTGWADPLTNDLYLHGLLLSHQPGAEDVESSLNFLRLALEKNPKLSRAWTLSASDEIHLAELGRLRPLEACQLAEEAARKALQLDPRDAEAHVWLGEAGRVLAWNLVADEAELNRAFEIDRNNVEAHIAAARLKQWVGLPNDSNLHLKIASHFDPLSPTIGDLQVQFDLMAGRPNDAVRVAQQLMETDPTYSHFESDLALAYREQGKLDQALDIYLRLQANALQPGLAITYARLNRPDDARKVLQKLIDRATDQYFPADQIAAVYVALGENDQAMQWLNRAMEEHSVSLHRVGCDRLFRPLHRNPSFRDLLRRIGLDPKRFAPP